MRISDWSSDVCSSDLFLTKLRSPLASCPDGFEIGGRLGSDVARRDDQRMPEILRADDIGEGVVAGGLHRFRNRQRQLFQRLVPQRIDCCESGALRMATGLLAGGVTEIGSASRRERGGQSGWRSEVAGSIK